MNERSRLEVVRLAGELDIARKEEVRDALQIHPNARAMLVDLSDVTYADSTALAELLRLCARAEEARVPVAVLAVTPQFTRVIRYAGLGDAFQLFDDRGSALTYLESVS